MNNIKIHLLLRLHLYWFHQTLVTVIELEAEKTIKKIIIFLLKCQIVINFLYTI